MTPPARDALALLLPPSDFIPVMLEVLRRKSLRGDRMPTTWATWLVRVREVRSGVLVPCVAGLTDAEWAELGECCAEFGEYVTEEAVEQATPPTANRTPEQLEHADKLVWTGIQNARRNEARRQAIAKENRYR